MSTCLLAADASRRARCFGDPNKQHRIQTRRSLGHDATQRPLLARARPILSSPVPISPFAADGSRLSSTSVRTPQVKAVNHGTSVETRRTHAKRSSSRPISARRLRRFSKQRPQLAHHRRLHAVRRVVSGRLLSPSTTQTQEWIDLAQSAASVDLTSALTSRTDRYLRL